RTIVLPVREPYTREQVLTPIVSELLADGHVERAEDLTRIVTLPLPPPERIDAAPRPEAPRRARHPALRGLLELLQRPQAAGRQPRPDARRPVARQGARRSTVRVPVDGVQCRLHRSPDPRDAARRAAQRPD